MRLSRGNSIVLKPGQQKIIGMGCTFSIFAGLGLFMNFMLPQHKGAILLLIGVALVFIMGEALVKSSPSTRITMTRRFLSGGTLRRKTIAWEKLGAIWSDEGTIKWKSNDAQSISCQIPWHETGWVCAHNGRPVSLALAMDWIEALRDAQSEVERDKLLRKFRKVAPKTFTPLNKLSTTDQAKADELLRGIKNFQGAERSRRVSETIQLFREKGWAPPKAKLLMNLLTPSTVIRCGLLVAIGVIIISILLGKVN